jgi:hydrogenase-4 component E
MINFTELILVVVLLSVLFSLGSTRVISLVKLMALQGIMVSLTPLFMKHQGGLGNSAILFYLAMILIKGVLIPGLLYLAAKRVAIKREIEPIIGYHASILTGLAIILASVFLANRLQVASIAGHEVALVTAITTMGAGFFLMMARVKAITQIIGYLMLENGIYLVGTALTEHHHTVYVVEFGVLLDLLVAVMIMGIILHNINRAFDDVDTTLLGRLKD